MASPLRWFRKYEKLLLGVFGVLIMFVFTLSIGSGIDPIIDWLSGGGVQTRSSMKGPMVAKWNGGSLNESDLLNMKQNRNLIIQYLFGVEQQANMRGRSPQTQPLPRLNSEESLLELALLQREANKQGIVITDEAVLNYLVQLSGGSMQPGEFLGLWKLVTQERGTERQLFALMKAELTAARLRSLVWSGTRAASPVAFWDFYNRTEKKVDAELMAIEAADFIDQVPEPSDRQRSDFYDLYAAKTSDPNSPTPGFRQRRRLAFETTRFDYQDFLEIEKEAVTAEEIETYYEENKSEFAQTLPEDDLEAPNASESSDDESTDSTESNESKEATADDATSETVNDAAANATDDVEDTGTAAESSANEPAPTPSPLPQETAVAETTTETDAGVASEEVAASKEEAADEEKSIDDGGTKETREKYKPLSEVKDEIRRSIAAPRAQEKMQEAIKTVRSRMSKYYKQHVMYEVRKRKEDSLEPPQVPTFDDVSENPPVTVTSIPLSDRFEIGQFELGQAVEFDFLQDRILRIPFADIVYEEKTIPAYQPRRFPSAEVSPQYVYWLVGQEEAITPALEDIRDSVVDAWKLKQAGDLALAAAGTQADKATKAGQKLSECLTYPNAAVFQSGQISWLTGGNLPMGGGNQLRISEIPGVEAPSEEMFRKLFRLKPGEVAVAMNQTKTTAYVMRSNEPNSNTIERAEQFLAIGMNSPAIYPILRQESQSLLGSWYNELKDDYEVTWLREPQGNSRMSR